MLENEEKLSLTELAKVTPGRPNASTLWRWCRKGHRGVRLEYLRFGRKIYTSKAAVDRFATRVAEIDSTPAAAPARMDVPRRSRGSSPRGRRRPQERAETVLKSAGI